MYIYGIHFRKRLSNYQKVDFSLLRVKLLSNSCESIHFKSRVPRLVGVLLTIPLFTCVNLTENYGSWEDPSFRVLVAWRESKTVVGEGERKEPWHLYFRLRVVPLPTVEVSPKQKHEKKKRLRCSNLDAFSLRVHYPEEHKW